MASVPYNAGVACADAPASGAPDRAAVIHEAQGSTATLTFAQLARRSSNVADMLVRSGVGRGDRVGVLAPAGIAAAVGHVAVLKAGAVSLPLVPLLGDEAIVHRLSDSGASAVLIDPALTHVPKGVGHLRGHVLDDATVDAPHDAGFTAAPTAPDDPAMVLYTSGTTGKPKGALQAHRVVLARQVPLSMIHGPFRDDDVFWTPVDWMWVGSLVDAVLGPLSHGCTVMTYERGRFDPAQAIERIKAFGVTRAFVPPSALRRLMDQPAGAWSGHRLRSVHSGGEPVSADAVAWARETLGVVVDEIYGLTEASFLVGNAHRFWPGTPGSMGRPFPGQAVRVADSENRTVGPGGVGELVVGRGSPSLFLGYHGRPDATAACFRDGWFGTGDLVSADADGRLFYVGRKDDLIMSSGHRIGPGEIEDVLRSHREVRDAVVVGEADAARGQRVKAVVQLRDPAVLPPAGLTGQLQELVRAQVGRHAYPRAVEYVAEFPRTVTGKVRRDVLRLPPDQRETAR